MGGGEGTTGNQVGNCAMKTREKNKKIERNVEGRDKRRVRRKGNLFEKFCLIFVRC